MASLLAGHVDAVQGGHAPHVKDQVDQVGLDWEARDLVEERELQLYNNKYISKSLTKEQ